MDIFLNFNFEALLFKGLQNTHFEVPVKVKAKKGYGLIVLITCYFHGLMINNITLHEMEKIRSGSCLSSICEIRSPYY